jgi:hypothetical protein
VIGPASLIQRSFGGNLEAVLAEAGKLNHWWAGSTPDPETGDPRFTWHRAGTITEAATGPGSIIQSTIGSPGNFEVVALEGHRLVHYWKDNSNPSRAFRRGGVITERATGPGCLIQSSIGSPGNFELVVPEGNRLMHYWKDNSDFRNTFQPGGAITHAAAGPAAIVQGRIGSPGNLEVIGPTSDGLAHWWKDPADLRAVAVRLRADQQRPGPGLHSEQRVRLERPLRSAGRRVLAVGRPLLARQQRPLPVDARGSGDRRALPHAAA